MTTCQHCGGPLDTAGGCHCLVGRNAVAAAVPIPAVIATGCPRCSAVVVVPLPAGATAAEARAERAERERDEARAEVARLREAVIGVHNAMDWVAGSRHLPSGLRRAVEGVCEVLSAALAPAPAPGPGEEQKP